MMHGEMKWDDDVLESVFETGYQNLVEVAFLVGPQSNEVPKPPSRLTASQRRARQQTGRSFLLFTRSPLARG
ncbi:MAG TPA: hypothetical protein VK395_22235 [Gemmataceae bacterium]|nr:hypothetical protein [Gemmataceae bacterium]